MKVRGNDVGLLSCLSSMYHIYSFIYFYWGSVHSIHLALLTAMLCVPSAKSPVCYLGTLSKHTCLLPVSQVALWVGQPMMALTSANHFALSMRMDFALIRTPFVYCCSHLRCLSHPWCFGWLVCCGLFLLCFDWSLSIGRTYGQC